MIANDAARGIDSSIVQVSAGYSDATRRILIANSDGVFATDEQVRTIFRVSAVANGDVEANIRLLVNGVSGTAMAAFGRQLSPVELSAIITYIRNSFGNNTGDLVQPADVTTILQEAQ